MQAGQLATMSPLLVRDGGGGRHWPLRGSGTGGVAAGAVSTVPYDIRDASLTGAFDVDVFDEGVDFVRVFSEEMCHADSRQQRGKPVLPLALQVRSTTHGRGCDSSRAAGLPRWTQRIQA